MAEGNERTENIMEGLIEDTELDGLLDDALLDYDTPSKPIVKPEQPQAVPVPPQMNPKELSDLNSMMQGLLGNDLMKEYEIFSKELEQNMPDMFNFQGLEGDIFGPGGHNPIPPSTNVSTEDTIQDLNKNLEKAKSAQSPGLEEGGEHMLGMVQELMGDLLSRDVLYEPMKELCVQYPKYLAEEEISLEDNQRFTRQLIVMEEICREYDSESNKDTQQIKLSRQNRILKLVQELQELGNPPNGLADTPALPNLTEMPLGDRNMCNQQ